MLDSLRRRPLPGAPRARRAGTAVVRLPDFAGSAAGSAIERDERNRAREVPGTEDRRTRLQELVLGPRVIDPLLRGAIVVFTLISLLPIHVGWGLRGDAGYGYLALELAVRLALLISAWLPAAGLGAFALIFGAHALVNPDVFSSGIYLAPVAVGLCVAGGRWWPAAAGTIGLTVAAVTAWSQNFAEAARYQPIPTVAVILVVATGLGLGAYLAQQRISAAIAAAAESARRQERLRAEHERALAEERMRVAADAHDTVSHALATESSILSVMIQQRRAGNDIEDAMLFELGLANAQAESEIRRLLARLRGLEDAQEFDRADVALRHTLAIIEERSATAGLLIEIGSVDLPAWLDREVLDGAILVLYELVTNMMKHAHRTGACTLAAGTEAVDGAPMMVLRGTNPVPHEAAFTPRSLVWRAQQLGGTCAVSMPAQEQVAVTVRFPLSSSSRLADDRIR